MKNALPIASSRQEQSAVFFFAELYNHKLRNARGSYPPPPARQRYEIGRARANVKQSFL